jgi:O-antigen/teichoic acid export membrane protein
MTRSEEKLPTNALPGGLRLSVYTACCGAAVAFLIHATAGLIIRTVYGNEFISGASALRILAWCVWANYAYGVLQQGAIVAGKQGEVAAATVAAVALNIGLNLWLIPRQGMLGAAVASVVAECTVLVGVLWTYRRRRGFRFLVLALVSTALAGGAAAGLASLVSGPSPLTALAVGVLGFLGVVVMTCLPLARRLERGGVALPGSGRVAGA